MKTSLRIGAAPGLRGLTGLLVLTLLLVGAAGAPAATAASAPPCYAWDFTNSTGQDADRLSVAIRDVQQVTSVYAGDDNLFGAPTSQGYDATAHAYRLAFSGGLVLDGAQNHLGVCTDRATLRLAPSGAGAPFFWKVGSQAVEPAPVFLGVSWDRLPTGALRITLYNDQSRALTVWSAALLTAGPPLALDDLNAATVGTLPAFAELADDVIVLDPGGTHTFDIPALALRDLTPGVGLVLDVAFSGGDDEGDAGRLLAQMQMAGALYLPLITR